MTKATETVKFLGALTAVWLVLNSGLLPLPTTFQNDVVPVLPWWVLVSFGSYSLFELGYGIVTLNDKPEKYKQLMEQIKEARADLASHGIN